MAIFLLPKAPHYGTKDHSLHYLVLLTAPPPTLQLPMKMVWLSGLSPVNWNLKLNGAYIPILYLLFKIVVMVGVSAFDVILFYFFQEEVGAKKKAVLGNKLL